jgi:hypothetical protein
MIIPAFVITLPPPIAGVDPATTAWVNQVVTNGGTVSAGRKTVVDTMIKGMKSDGVWTELDRLWIFAAENTQSALTDMVALALATANGAPTFTTDRGYTGVNASATVYIASGFNPTTGSPHFVQNSAHVSTWVVTYTAATGSGGTCMGSFLSGFADTELDVTFGDGKLYSNINDPSTSVGLTAPTTKTGHWIANRSGASASQSYQNGANFASPNTTSVAPGNRVFNILAMQIATPTQGTPNQLGMASFGGSLSSTDVTNFYNRLRTYMTAVGVP